ncbi:unnamed protein product [Rotaria sp. Silwood1]|nr:unnamed protein product [Rotaria sp. Silwood1]CAF1540435.1 unnamed protein product [Rotaria sp. Silwood1]CAF3694359.1 unnamed protein product [Rotaria sp. Silwood1]
MEYYDVREQKSEIIQRLDPQLIVNCVTDIDELRYLLINHIEKVSDETNELLSYVDLLETILAEKEDNGSMNTTSIPKESPSSTPITLKLLRNFSNVSSSIVVPRVSEFSPVPHISPWKEKSPTNEHTRRRKGPVAFLPSSSSNHLSPGMFPSIYALQILEKGTLSLIFIFLIADRLVDIEDAINNLIAYVNTLREDVASIAVQLKPLLKNIKIIHNVTSIRSLLRKKTMTIYTRNEILSNKHLDEPDERYETVIDALQNGFDLNDGTINALFSSLKEARNQLAKYVRYLKVMKQKLDRNVANDDDGAPVQGVQIIDEDQTF